MVHLAATAEGVGLLVETNSCVGDTVNTGPVEVADRLAAPTVDTNCGGAPVYPAGISEPSLLME